MIPDIALILFGIFVGTAGTLIGAGGGFLMMPIFLILYKDYGPEVLTAISLAVICANAISGSIAYARMKRIDYKAGILFSLAAMPGAAAGAIIVKYIPVKMFDISFGVLLIGLAIYLLISSKKRLQDGRGDAKCIPHYSIKTGMVISSGVGLVSSIFGIGGGIVHVPMMVYVLCFPVHFATATSHFTLAIMSLTGTLVHISQGNLTGHYHMVICLAAGVLVGAQIGAKLSQRFKSIWIIRFLSIALALAGLRVLYQGF